MDQSGRESKADFKVSLEQLGDMAALLGLGNAPAHFWGLMKGSPASLLGILIHWVTSSFICQTCWSLGPVVPDQQQGRHLQANPKKCRFVNQTDNSQTLSFWEVCIQPQDAAGQRVWTLGLGISSPRPF